MLSTSLPPFQFFGSEDSVDLDVVFFIAAMPDSIIEKATLAKHSGELLQESYPHQKINTNLAVCEKGVLTQVYKGTSDELNNALYHTYALHKQMFEKQILEILPRDPDLKVLRCLRMILSLCSKTVYREMVKEALRADVHSKIATLKSINFLSINDFGKSLDPIEVKKTIAFQLGQTLSLLQDIECYTKSDVVGVYSELQPYIYRYQSTDWYVLQKFIKLFLTALDLRLPQMKYTEEYPYRRES